MGTLTTEIALRTLLLFLMLGSIAGLLTGAVLIMRPDWMLRLGKYTNRWVSTRQLNRKLERKVKLDRWFYRHHQASGSLMLAGALWIIGFFTIAFDKPRSLAALSKNVVIPPALMEGLLDALVVASLTGAVFAVIISLFLLLRPSLLRGFEQGANQWLSLRRALKPLEISHSGVDEYVLGNFRLIGILLLFGSLYTLVMFVFWLG